MVLAGGLALGAQPAPAPHPLAGSRWTAADVDFMHPVYVNEFEDVAALADWQLEGGLRMGVERGNLVLESQPGTTVSQANADHLVCWLRREMPADFLFEFTVRPVNRAQGLNIVIFNARGIHGEEIFNPALAPRDGTFAQYHSGDLDNYHCSYWAGDRSTANLRKNKGFKLVATGPDLVADAPPGGFQTIRVYKRGGTIRVTVDDVVSVAWDDDGKAFGPAITRPGWIGLRQMAHTVRCEYGRLRVYPIKGK